MGVTEFGLFVELKGFYVQGLLHISELGSDYFQYQPQSLALVGERSGRRFSLGDELSVVLVDVVPEEGKLDLRARSRPSRPAARAAGPAATKQSNGAGSGPSRQRPTRTEQGDGRSAGADAGKSGADDDERDLRPACGRPRRWPGSPERIRVLYVQKGRGGDRRKEALAEQARARGAGRVR